MQFNHIGKDVLIREWVRFGRPEHIWIGNHVRIDDFVLLAGGLEELTRIGNYVHIASFCNVQGGGGVTMQDFTGIAPGCRLFSDTADYVNGGLMGPTIPLEFHNDRAGHIVLERFVVLGANCVVMPGVTIGEGATVGACSFINRDLAPWTVNVGIPARPIKKRNKEGVLQRAEELMRRYLD